MYSSRKRTLRGSRLLAGAGLSRVLGIPFVLKFHLILPVWETLETGCKPVPAMKIYISVIELSKFSLAFSILYISLLHIIFLKKGKLILISCSAFGLGA